VQAGAMLFLHLFCRNNSAAEVCQSPKLVLDCFQPFLPASVSNLSHCTIPNCTPKLLIQLLNVSDLHSEMPNLVPKNP
jgi:hypothetical protein